MTMRRTLPNWRQTEALEFDHDGVRYIAAVGYFKTGGVAEVFLRAGKEGSAVSILTPDLAVTASIGLQIGVPISVIRKALQQLPDGSGAGPLGKLLDLVELTQYG